MIVAVGMDPGPKPGLVKLGYSDGALIGVHVVQCSADIALDILELMLHTPATFETYFGVERYVDRQHGRSGAPGQRTRDMVGSAVVLATANGAMVTQRNASKVKAWATDDRLDKAGLMEPTKGMPHARDGARHALYTAVHDGKILDPYSKRARRTDG